MRKLLLSLVMTAFCLCCKPAPLPLSIPYDTSPLLFKQEPINSFAETSPYCRLYSEVVNDSVVFIRSINSETQYSCSGVVVGPDRVLTAKHCILKDSSILVSVAGTSYAVFFLYPSQDQDVMMLHLQTNISHPNIVKQSHKHIEIFDSLFVVGFGCSQTIPPLLHPEWPLKRTIVVTNTTLIRKELGTNIVRVQGCVCHGDSGGPVFNGDGELVGIATATLDEGATGIFVNTMNFMKNY